MIVIAALPFVVTDRALAAPALLKASLKKYNIDSVALDLNNDVLVRVNSSKNKVQLHTAFLYNVFSDNAISEYSHLVKFCAKKILDQSPSLIGLSLFCSSCKAFCQWLCAELRQHTDVPIVIGGPGIIHSPIWLDELVTTNLINDYISGDGEISFVEYVKGNKNYPGINSHQWYALSSLEDSVIPDYGDYNFYAYAEPSVPVIDSRGCVQSCEFCNVIEIWKKFQYKTADEIFNEMLHQIRLHNIYKFEFRSSISNGNFREFKKLMSLIADYNSKKLRNGQISWEGSFIVRSSKDEKLWDVMGKTNPSLFLGVESLVDTVRKNLGKNFSNNDLLWTLDQIEKHKIDAKLLLISGYPTETTQHWEETKQWFIDNKKYASVIRETQISQATILPDTELFRRKDAYGIESNGISWANRKTKISTEQRTRYHFELVHLAKSLGFIISG